MGKSAVDIVTYIFNPPSRHHSRKLSTHSLGNIYSISIHTASSCRFFKVGTQGHVMTKCSSTSDLLTDHWHPAHRSFAVLMITSYQIASHRGGQWNCISQLIVRSASTVLQLRTTLHVSFWFGHGSEVVIVFRHAKLKKEKCFKFYVFYTLLYNYINNVLEVT